MACAIYVYNHLLIPSSVKFRWSGNKSGGVRCPDCAHNLTHRVLSRDAILNRLVLPLLQRETTQLTMITVAPLLARVNIEFQMELEMLQDRHLETHSSTATSWNDIFSVPASQQRQKKKKKTTPTKKAPQRVANEEEVQKRHQHMEEEEEDEDDEAAEQQQQQQTAPTIVVSSSENHK